jgi:hypothetical protein
MKKGQGRLAAARAIQDSFDSAWGIRYFDWKQTSWDGLMPTKPT